MLSIEEAKAGKPQSREEERKDVKGGEGREKMRQRTSRKLEVLSREVNILALKQAGDRSITSVLGIIPFVSLHLLICVFQRKSKFLILQSTLIATDDFVSLLAEVKLGALLGILQLQLK